MYVESLGRETRLAMVPVLLILTGALIAGLYALARLAALDGVSPLGLLYWQAVSSAVIVSAIALLSGDRPRLPLRRMPRYAIAIVLGSTPALLTSYGVTGEIVPGVALAAVAPALLLNTGLYSARNAQAAGLSPIGVASGMLIALALVLDPIVASAHAIVLPGLSFGPLDWIFWGTSVLTSAFYVTALALAVASSEARTRESRDCPSVSSTARSDLSKGCPLARRPAD